MCENSHSDTLSASSAYNQGARPGVTARARHLTTAGRDEIAVDRERSRKIMVAKTLLNERSRAALSARDWWCRAAVRAAGSGLQRSISEARARADRGGQHMVGGPSLPIGRRPRPQRTRFDPADPSKPGASLGVPSRPPLFPTRRYAQLPPRRTAAGPAASRCTRSRASRCPALPRAAGLVVAEGGDTHSVIQPWERNNARIP